MEPGGPPSWRFVNEAGYRAHQSQFTLTSAWPFHGIASLAELAAHAEREGILHKFPEAGDLYLMHDDEVDQFVRTGIVVHVIAGGMPAHREVESTVLAIDGVRSAVTAEKRGAFIEQLSSLRGDRFVRWVELDGRERIGTAPAIENAERQAA
jgi:hypothetical protein